MFPTIFGKTLLQRVVLAVIAASLSGCFDSGSSDDGSGNGTNPLGEGVTQQPQPGSGNGSADDPVDAGSPPPAGGSEDVPIGGEPLPTPANQPPEVKGTPEVSATAGQSYLFKPEASDPDGDFLEYTITNQPEWSTFDTETGVLSGTPEDTHVGETEEITITVTDGRDTRSIGFKIKIKDRTETPLPGNNPPTISGVATATILVDQAYSFTPTASDPDGDRLRFTISGRPSWASFSTSTGRLSGTPRTANIATYSNIVISVNDGVVTRSLPAFSIQVQGPNNRAPTISGSPATSVQALQTYTFQPAGSDPDGDTLVYRINNRPRWATFSTATGRLSGAPPAADVGTYSNLIISVSDGRVSTSLPAFTITVTAPANRAPTISGTAPTTATIGVGYSFTPTANDPDAGTTLGFTIQNRPAWAAFDTATGRLSGTPTTVGTFSNIAITVSDGRVSASLPAFSINVAAPSNSAPTISGSPATSVNVGSAYNFQPSASDPNGDTLSFNIQNAPSWATFNASTGRLSGTPSTANAGTYSNIVISVSDGARVTSLPSFAITVSQGATGSATLSWAPPTQNTDGTSLTNLAGYRVVYGLNSSNLDRTVEITNPGIATYTITGLTSGTWHFAVRAYNSAGGESEESNIGSKTIP